VDDAFEIVPYVEGVVFPATKQQLVARAYSNGAAMDILMAFHDLPEREYVSAREVRESLQRRR
jgi:hypothetical protein